MNSINIYGRLVRDPELKAYTNSKGESNTMCNFTVAVNRRFGDDADFFNCTIFGKRVEVIDKFFRKASRIAVSGEMQCNKKDDKYYWNLLVSNFDFVDTKNDSINNQNPLPESFEEIEEDVPF